MLPDFPVGCKRLTPGPGYLESLCEDNVGEIRSMTCVPYTFRQLTRMQAELIIAPIRCINERGIVTEDDVEHEVDMIVCATGFDVRLLPNFPIYGLGGVNIQDAWAEETRSYLGISAAELPNL